MRGPGEIFQIPPELVVPVGGFMEAKEFVREGNNEKATLLNTLVGRDTRWEEGRDSGEGVSGPAKDCPSPLVKGRIIREEGSTKIDNQAIVSGDPEGIR
jgi:hypothetical protein